MGPVNKSIFEKFLLSIKIVLKTFSILDKFFSKISLLFCTFKTHISKIHYKFSDFCFCMSCYSFIYLFIYLLKLNIISDFTKMNIESEKSAQSVA